MLINRQGLLGVLSSFQVTDMENRASVSSDVPIPLCLFSVQ